jgi:hypothetical protein
MVDIVSGRGTGGESEGRLSFWSTHIGTEASYHENIQTSVRFTFVCEKELRDLAVM